MCFSVTKEIRNTLKIKARPKISTDSKIVLKITFNRPNNGVPIGKHLRSGSTRSSAGPP